MIEPNNRQQQPHPVKKSVIQALIITAIITGIITIMGTTATIMGTAATGTAATIINNHNMNQTPLNKHLQQPQQLQPRQPQQPLQQLQQRRPQHHSFMVITRYLKF